MDGKYSSALYEARVQAALSSLAQVDAPVQTQTSPQAGVLAALSTLAQADAPVIQAADSRLPQGSTLLDAKVQTALNNLAQMELPGSQQGVNPFAAPTSLLDRNVSSALQELAQMEIRQPEQNGIAVQQPSSLVDPDVRQALNKLSEQGQLPVSMALVKNALNGGELAPDMHARYDLPRYQNGCEKLLNMIPLPGGGITKRPGLRFVSGADSAAQDTTSRLFPFIYSASAQLMLMFLANAGGGQVYILDRDGKNPARPSALHPYRKDDLPNVSFCQCGKNIYLAHPAYPPAKLEWNGNTFAYRQLNFANKTPIPDIAGFSYEGLAELNTFRNIYYKVTAVNDETGEESLPSPEHCWFTCTLTSSFSALIKVKPVSGCHEYRIYKKRGGEFGFIGRLVLPDDYEAPGIEEGTEPAITGEDADVFHDTGYEPDVTDPPPAAQAFFTGKDNYPAIVFIHQQRLGWASTNNDPLTIWLSQTSNFECLASKTPPQDDDGIEVTLASTQANRILWAISDRSGLAIGTEGEEWYLTGASGEGTALTPNSISFQPQTHYGTEPGTEALRANSSMLFVQKGGHIIRDLGFSYQSDRYEGQDVTLLARHIFQATRVADWCWQSTPANILWCVTANNNLAGLEQLYFNFL